MEILKETELKNVKGGFIGSKLIMALVTGGSFVIGLIDGLRKPK